MTEEEIIDEYNKLFDELSPKNNIKLPTTNLFDSVDLDILNDLLKTELTDDVSDIEKHCYI